MYGYLSFANIYTIREKSGMVCAVQISGKQLLA